jgi:hypothetical protein
MTEDKLRAAYPSWHAVTSMSSEAERDEYRLCVSGVFERGMDEEREELMRENAAMRAQLDARVKVRAVGGGV